MFAKICCIWNNIRVLNIIPYTATEKGLVITDMGVRFKRLLAEILIISTALCVFSSCQNRIYIPTSIEAFLLDTIVKITIYAGGGEEEIEQCFTLCREYEKMFSRTLEDSEISQLNSRARSEVSDETSELISLGLEYAKLTSGAIDISIEPVSSLWNFKTSSPLPPDVYEMSEALAHVGWEKVTVNGNTVTFSDDYTRLDLGAIAKGYIADRLKDYLVSVGVTSAIINLGGNIQCIGQKNGTENFTVGIQYPFEDKIIAVADIADMSMVTSGTYERYFVIDDVLYHHILNPETGLPASSGLLSVTIFCENSATADALSTACFVLGYEAGAELIDSLDGVHAMFITSDSKVHLTSGFEDYINISVME